ncbi:HNH endonuclease family protein [Streptomyces bikiniensis]|uniref:HNH endonuclease family protein n=1 Tax=Streptomyces bikiniensis TaxID=1896 RepID=UPI000A4077B1|nr:HNH endonuclease family protein [Streptomyces bikiniensis]
MITNLLRGAAAFCLALTPLALPSPTSMAAAATAVGVPVPEVLPLEDAVGKLPVAEEDRTGYTRDSFRHWNTGLDAGDGCNTRNEVLLAEAVQEPAVAAGCKLTGGKWLSYYDNVEVSEAGKLDIDHMVPLAEAWDSGASTWTPAKREAYANDQGAAASLVAVTARTNRSKADQDPATWMPPTPRPAKPPSSTTTPYRSRPTACRVCPVALHTQPDGAYACSVRLGSA